MSPEQLDELFRKAKPGPIPEWRRDGTALACSGTWLQRFCMARALVLVAGKSVRREGGLPEESRNSF